MQQIVVCIKAVPDPDSEQGVKIDPVTRRVDRGNVATVMNPIDRNALQAALELKASHGAAVTVLSMGPPEAGNIVKEALALGADRGVLLSDPAFAGADAYATAATLAAGVRALGGADLVLCGMASSDGATEWVGPQLATVLDLPVVTMVRELVETDEDRWKLKADFEGGYRLVQVELPAVLTVTRELNRPKRLSFSGIIKARKKEIEIWDLAALDLTPEEVGQAGSPTIVGEAYQVEKTRQVEMLTGEREEKAAELLNRLVQEGMLS
jgi:electron transfer flavoprotein beta subunit